MGAPPTATPATAPVANELEEAVLRDANATAVPVPRGRFELVSVEQAPMPHGGQGTDWCRYVLSCGASRIMGLRRGTLDEVTAFAAGCLEDFNRRTVTGKGMAGIAYTKKKASSQGPR